MVRLPKFLVALLLALGVSSLLSACKTDGKMNIEKRGYSETPNRTAVDLYTLSNANAMEVKITNYGGIIVENCL
ncbi:MAG: hypothetical protein ACE5HX_12780 [bacterium]